LHTKIVLIVIYFSAFCPAATVAATSVLENSANDQLLASCKQKMHAMQCSVDPATLPRPRPRPFSSPGPSDDVLLVAIGIVVVVENTQNPLGNTLCLV